jgi:hypothetical protein
MKHITNTSKLLIQEHPLQVLPTLAVKIGLNQAIFLQKLHSLMLNNPNKIDEKIWISVSYIKLEEMFPFWSRSTVILIVRSLEKSGLISSTDKFNVRVQKNRINNTKWYTINYDCLPKITI